MDSLRPLGRIMTITAIDSSLLTAYYFNKAGITTSDSSGSGSGATPTVTPPTPPWSSASTATPASALIQSVLTGGKFIDPNAAQISVPGADKTTAQNYTALFGLYQGLSALSGLADKAAAKNVSSYDLTQAKTAFQTGLKQVQTYLDSKPFTGFDVVQGAVTTTAKTSIGATAETDTYQTGVLYTGTSNGEVPAFQGDVQFSTTVKRGGTTQTVAFDLSEMASTPRTMGNVVNYLNSKLQAAGISTRFANVRTAGTAQSVTVGSKTITLPVSPDQFSLKINGNSVEHMTFTAPTATPAVYLAQSSGVPSVVSPTDSVRQLVKFDAGSAPVATSPADGLVFQNPLDSAVSEVKATASAPDGSVYVLGSVSGTVAGQTIQGAQDLALLKYDPAGHLLYTRTLGAQGAATGLALAVSADGSQVAVAGSIQGALDSSDGKVDPATTDTMVSVFDSAGQELWTQRSGTANTNDQPNSVAFGADGTVYVAGQTSGTITGGGGAQGGTSDSYLKAFAAKSVPLRDGTGQSQWVPHTVFSTQFGTAGSDRATGVVVNGSSVVVAGVEDGHAVLRRFDLQSSGAPTLGATRDMGDLQGGDVTGLALNADGSVVVAGSTHNGALAAGTVTQAYAGKKAAFVADVSADLQPSAGDTLAYLGDGARDQTASGLTVSGGKVFLTGQITTGTEIVANKTVTAHDGYVAELDPATGQTVWSRTYTGRAGEAAPSGIAVAAAGASVLDALGLPNGAVNYSTSDQVVANTSARAGDQFLVKSGQGGASHAITIAAQDTYATLAAKISRTLGFQATVTTATVAGVTKLQIKPLNDRYQIELQAGPQGRDALGSLGLTDGLITTDAFTAKATAPGSVSTNALPAANQLKGYYGLQVPNSLDLNSANDIKQAQAALLGALSTVRSIYRDMTTAPASASQSKGTVPAYLTNEIKNYQAALARLTGGG